MTSSMTIYVSGVNRWIKEETLVLRRIFKDNDVVWNNVRQSKYVYSTLGYLNNRKKELVFLDELLIYQTLTGLKTGAIYLRIDTGGDLEVENNPKSDEDYNSFIFRYFSDKKIPNYVDYDVLSGDAHIFDDEYVNFDFTFICTNHNVYINPFNGLSLSVLIRMPIQKAFGLYSICKEIFDFEEIVIHLKRCLMEKFSKDMHICMPINDFENTLVDVCFKSYLIKKYNYKRDQVCFWTNPKNFESWDTLIVNDYGNGRVEKQYLTKIKRSYFIG